MFCRQLANYIYCCTQWQGNLACLLRIRWGKKTFCLQVLVYIKYLWEICDRVHSWLGIKYYTTTINYLTWSFIVRLWMVGGNCPLWMTNDSWYCVVVYICIINKCRCLSIQHVYQLICRIVAPMRAPTSCVYLNIAYRIPDSGSVYYMQIVWCHIWSPLSTYYMTILSVYIRMGAVVHDTYTGPYLPLSLWWMGAVVHDTYTGPYLPFLIITSNIKTAQKIINNLINEIYSP